MARFYQLYVRRSDGKLEVVGKIGRKEPNQPTDEQMDQKPDKNGVSDFYREVAPDEVKHLDWRRKLGGMLARELKIKEKNPKSGTESGYILAAFPENYRIFEHVKKSEKDGKTEVKTKTHAAGGNDRQDAYLYGHPSGRRKRYRSPADFFPHLLWLCTDESGDPDNCSCKICCPEELENIVPAAKVPKEKIVKEPVPAPTPTPQPSVSLEPVKVQRAFPPATPLPQTRSLDQQMDGSYTGFKYRQGEMCWFSRGPAWGLGVILRRWSAQGRLTYTIQPLSYPDHRPISVNISKDEEMRPWLAWSVPEFTFAGLNNLTPLPQYETMDWQGLRQGRFGPPGDIEVDSSILAAKSIDSSYTPFNVLAVEQVQYGIQDTFYEGIFLGAEKIWRGEPVRLFIGSGTDIMIVQVIVERTTNGKLDIPHFIGDIYTLAETPHADPSIPTPASPMNNTYLPQRLTDDLAHRNARSIQTRGVANYWKIISKQARVEVSNVKGRWYEASLFLPILQADIYKKQNAEGNIKEVSSYVNARGDCLQANRHPKLPKISRLNVRRNTRLEAFLQAVPPGIQISDDISQPTPSHGDKMDIDQYMSLDGIGNGFY